MALSSFSRRRPVAATAAEPAPDTARAQPNDPASSSSETVLPTSGTVAPTAFFGSQIGGQSVINHSYTDLPWKLFAHDIYSFFRYAWALPYVLWPITPADSGPLAELAPTRANLWCIAVHAVLAVAQLVFIVAILPAAFLLPVWTAAGLVALFLGANHLLCLVLLNGVDGRLEFPSHPECAPALPEHAHEQWVYLNGVTIGQHWMQSNVDRLALTFKRPVLGIHNKTSGFLFDIIECLIQRNYTYATRDVRACYSILKKKLYCPDITKLVFILHSQGAIEGGLVLDWLLQELPQDLLSKLEVYTFGNAANHFNNPHRTVRAQKRHFEACGSVSTEAGAAFQPLSADRASLLVAESSATQPAILTGKAIGHIEHYAHRRDFVALWGVLHFVSSAPTSHMIPRFFGSVFARSSPRGGHLLCQHYLDGMFPLAFDPQTGAPVGCAETGNEFMESEIELGHEGDESADVQETAERSWLATLGDVTHATPRRQPTSAVTHDNVARDLDGGPSHVEIHASSPVIVRQASHPRPVKVKDVSRLWLYRNGRSPDDRIARGPSRQATA